MNTEDAYENTKHFDKNIAKYYAECLYLLSTNAMFGKYGSIFLQYISLIDMHCANDTMQEKIVKNQNNKRKFIKCNLFSLWEEENIGSGPVYLLRDVIIAGWFMHWNLSTPHYILQFNE